MEIGMVIVRGSPCSPLRGSAWELLVDHLPRLATGALSRTVNTKWSGGAPGAANSSISCCAEPCRRELHLGDRLQRERVDRSVAKKDPEVLLG